MNRYSTLLLFSFTAILSVACNGQDPEQPTGPQPPAPDTNEIAALLLSDKTLWLPEGKSAGLSVRSLILKDGSAVSPEGYEILWQSSAPQVASVSEDGTVKGLESGSTTVTASVSGISARAEVRVKDGESTTGFASKLTGDNIYSMGQYLKYNAVIQGFDILKDGTPVYMQLAGNMHHQLVVTSASTNKGGFTGSYKESMSFNYFGHGTNYAVEEAEDGIYIWLGSYASKNTSGNKIGQYWNNQTIARVKFEDGKTVKPSDCTAQFYMGPYKEIHPAIDIENDILAINYPTSHPSEPRRFRMYRLSEAMALPLSLVTLQSITYGGGTSPDPEKTETPKVYAKDLRKLTPVGEFGIPNQGLAPNPDDVSHYAWQGFEVNDGLVYYFEGEGRNDGQPSAAYVTIYNFKGDMIEKRTAISAASDILSLSSAGITASGYMEAEGIKVRNGKVYLGFASRDSKNDGNKCRANIFVYDKVK